MEVERKKGDDIKSALKPLKKTLNIGINYLGERIAKRYPKGSVERNTIKRVSSSGK